ncbi:MAG TPA: DUF1553 domain-containing protein, partial [Verrucomicrobiae bacterium]|nr:DUF1553 domain-containing protein [Verrucomicrobiae bacterium]
AIFQAAYDPEKWLPGIWSDPHPGPIRAIPILDRRARKEYDRHSRAWPGELVNLEEQVNGGLLRHWRDPDLINRATEITNASSREKLLTLLHKSHADRSPEEEKFIGFQAEKLGLDPGALQTKYPQFSNALARAKARLEQIKADGKTLPPVIWATFDVSTNPSPTHLLRRGEYEQPGPEVAPGVLSALDPYGTFRILPPACSESTGRRLALARWLTRRDHPLTARVIVNRIWQYHFGTGLVATPDDFGARGARPTHPELLDWLAAELMDHNWSLKHIHRLILNSASYRQSSHNPRVTSGDSQSEKLLAQFPTHRLEGEIVRDTMLELAGRLDTRLFGESIPTQRQADGRSIVSTNSPDRNRRSVYISTRRTTVPTFLSVFDMPAMDTNWPKRKDSVIPQQALALMNSSFVLDCAEQFARDVLHETAGSFNSALQRAFLLAYGRAPQQDEIDIFAKFSATQKAAGDNQEKIWTTICHALLSSNEFLYVD